MEPSEGEAPSLVEPALELLMPQHDDLSRSRLTLDQAGTLIAVIEMSQSSWLVAAIVPGIARHPLKKINPDETILLGLLRRWQDEAARAGRTITRIAIAYEAGRDGFWLARWLRARGIEAYVIHPTASSEISCLGGHDGWKGAQRCPDAKSLIFLMPSWTSFWLGPIPRRPLIRTDFLTA